MTFNVRPLVTIVTACFNAAATIEKTIVSVLGQTYQPIEYIVMDGGSTDGTVEIARRYADHLTLVSEADSGQSNAINKGWRMAHGELLAFLNADDQYLPDTIAEAEAYLELHPDAGWIYGTPHSVGSDQQAMPFNRSSLPWDYDKLLTIGCYVSQPTTLLRRKIVDEFGLFDEALEYTMDYEYWLRIGRRYPGHLVPSVRAIVVRSRNTKTQSGGGERIEELMTVTRRYGSEVVPLYVRHQWAMAHARTTFRQLRARNLRQAIDAQRKMWRYPSAALWGMTKMVARQFMGEATESKARRLLLGKK